MTVVAPSVRTVDGEEIVSRMVVMVELSAVASQRAVVVPCWVVAGVFWLEAETIEV
jgi:hypothetical protein